MRYLYLCALVAMALLASCGKDQDVGNPPPAPPDSSPKDSTTISFPKDTIGLSELYETSQKRLPTFVLSKAKPNRAFTYSIVGKNGGLEDLKTATDTLVEGRAQADANGYTEIFAPGLTRYKDGEISVVLRFENPDTMITVKFQKAEYEIRNYRDFMLIGFHSGYEAYSDYVQVNDFAFPDTVFKKSPCGIFYGSYDGQGYKITNLTIKVPFISPGTELEAGLFERVQLEAVLKNIRLELSEEGLTTAGGGNFGGLVGYITTDCSIINCSVKGNISVPTNVQAYVGGLTGYAIGTKIIGCSFRGKISGPNIGGISGFLASSQADICYVYASFNGVKAGGITALRGGGFSVSNSYAVADTVPADFEAIAPVPQSDVVLTNCFANTGPKRNGVTIAPLSSINTLLADMLITKWPQEVTPPANNKPYKNDTDPTAPMKLWWE